MATINTARRVLDAIISAPHSIGQPEILANAELQLADVDLMAALIAGGYIKENRQRPGTFFTRTPKRDVIRGFIAGANALPGLTFTADAPQLTPGDIRENDAHEILKTIRRSEHAVQPHVGYNRTMLQEMVDAGLIKEHRDQPGFYFTRKPYRDEIDAFLNSDLTYDELLDATVEEDIEHSEDCPCGEGFHTNVNHTGNLADATNSLFDQIEAIRNQLSALLNANGR